MGNLGWGIIAYSLAVAALLGLVVGSFVNCWAWRYVRGESVVRGRSHCATCGHDLSARDLVPLVSWLSTHGTCRYCGQKVSARYPLTELVCALAFVGVVAVYGLTLETVELLAFAGILLFLSLVDLEERIIPNGCIIAALAVRAAYLAASCAMGTMDLATVGYYVLSGMGLGLVLVVVVLVADRVFGRESMGGGDLKLYTVAGMYFGWQQGLFLVIVSCIIGILVAALAPAPKGESQPEESPQPEEGSPRADEQAPQANSPLEPRLAQDGQGDSRRNADGQSDEGSQPEEGPQSPEVDSNPLHRAIPFGPSIAAACVITMLAGGPVLAWYLSLL